MRNTGPPPSAVPALRPPPENIRLQSPRRAAYITHSTVPNHLLISAMAHPSIVTIAGGNFAAEVTASDKPVLVDFWAEWCGPCKMLSPVLDELAEELGDKVKIAKVNVDDNRDLAMQFGVKSIPMLLFFKNGEIKDKVVGLMPKDSLSQKLTALV